ncbi:SgcJ/EcaC family oxidoreductase [Nocardia brasiliensis]|uniref:SgcJ/EcaC family oxidoreductase n=1 Tax=Nocardia brasiliensis TaxID=37326 RepID=A0A6G9XVC0_NOCBR|nr:SgcJ/EcaC family oxidoreductase [Nocardia brasiliensis]QIS04836.1 SgcJ/EcaC family oxidoreductase [Nocardia brasiliensis]
MNAKTFDAPVLADTSVDHRDDMAAIEQLIASVQTAYNTNDADLMTEGFTANAAVVNAVGTLMTGRADLLAANQAGLAGFLKDEYVRYDVTDITFLRPDVAIAHKVARATTAEGELIDTDPAMIALYVLVKENGRWWTAARQNTLIPS